MGAAIKMEEVFNKINPHSPGLLYEELLDHFPITQITSKQQCKDANTVISRLIELSHFGKYSKSDLAQVDMYIQLLAECVRNYENQLLGTTKSKGHEMLAHLMELKNLNQSDLAKELGGQSIVSSILKGKRELNKKQIQKLAERFQVSVETFFDR